MSSLIDLSGLRFGRLLVLRRAPTVDKRTRWVCLCDCGTIKAVLAYNIKHPDAKRRIFSCGCQGRENRRRAATTHGLSKTAEMRMFYEAKKRAKQKGLEFNIAHTDIEIPAACPLLGIPLFVIGDVQTANSPALDRINSSKGYVKGNIQVISTKANTMKHDATFEEFEKVYFGWRSAIKCDI